METDEVYLSVFGLVVWWYLKALADAKRPSPIIYPLAPTFTQKALHWLSLFCHQVTFALTWGFCACTHVQEDFISISKLSQCVPSDYCICTHPVSSLIDWWTASVFKCPTLLGHGSTASEHVPLSDFKVHSVLNWALVAMTCLRSLESKSA